MPLNNPLSAAEAALFEMSRLVRYGFSRDVGDLGEWKNIVGKKIHALREALQDNPSTLDITRHMQFGSLEAEYYDILGQAHKSRTVLAEYFLYDAAQPSGALAPFRQVFGEEQLDRRDPELSARWVRQACWLHMTLAWTWLFRLGRPEVALNYLNNTREFLANRLPGSYLSPSHGTLSRLEYYAGHCHRLLRGFPASLDAFMKAQEHARERYLLRSRCAQPAQEFTGDTDVLATDQRFSTICTAQILGGGLAWIAIHQGQFRHAEELSLSAQTLLADTGQEPLKRFVESVGLIAKRRRTAPLTTDARNAMSGLLTAFARYRRAGDKLGQIRCGGELIRGQIEFITYWAGDSLAASQRSIRFVQRWLSRLDIICAKADDPYDKVRVELMRVRFLAVTNESDSKSLGESLRPLAPPSGDTPFIAELEICRALVLRKAHKYSAALQTLRSVVDKTRDQDPVIEAECRLHIAHIYLEEGNYDAARHEFHGWQRIERLIENAYLQRFAAQIDHLLNSEQRPFVIKADDDLNWERRERELQIWLSEAAVRRAGGRSAPGKTVAGILGINASSWSRWQQKGLVK